MMSKLEERGGTMLRPVMSASAREARRILRVCAVVFALLGVTLMGALAMPTRAEAKRLTVKLEIENLDEHPEIKDTTFAYVCSFFPWQGFVSAGWRLNPSTGQWQWANLTDKWVTGPDDHDGRYWHNLSLKPGQSQTVDVGERNSCFYFYPVISPFAQRRTDPGLSLQEVIYTGNTWTISYNDNNWGPQSIVPFNMGGFPSNNDGSVTLKMRYDKGLPKPPDTKFELALQNEKKIDYLGDGHPNADTPRNGPNDYRVYLSSRTVDNTKYEGYKPKNIILALDRSLSMSYTFGGADNNSNERWNSLKRAANRLMDGVGGSELGNTFSVVTFSSDDDYGHDYVGGGTQARVTNTSLQEAKRVVNGLSPSPNGGTDYYSAFQKINECCVSDRENIVLFITDGEPTSLPKNVLRRLMGSTAQSVIATTYTREAATKYLSSRNIKSFYSVFIGTNQGSAAVLNMITRATNIPNNERASVQASNDEEMQKLIDALTQRIKKPTIGVAMEDTLSPYVQYMGEVKVTAQEEGQANAVDLREGVDYTLNQSGKKLTLRISKAATKNTLYTFSYNVDSGPGIQPYKDNRFTYPDIGDGDTDYDASNLTSSNKPGFFESTKAVGQITYNVGAGYESVDYDFPKPVVQVKYTEGGKGKIGGHVTLYNQELTRGRFNFDLIAEDGAITRVSNDEKGDFKFPEILYDKDEDIGTHTFTLRQAAPDGLDEKGFSSSDNMQYTPVIKDSEPHYCEFKVTVTVAKIGDVYDVKVKYTNPQDGSTSDDAHFYNTYGIQGTYQ